MKTLSTLLIAFCLLSLSGLQAQTFVHASATGANDGSSWADAYTDLSTAISRAALNEEIWVAAGTYIPNNPTGRSATFRITKSIQLYGGFAGTETQLSERNPQAHICLLSGDVNGDDTTVGDSLVNRSDNVYNIMKITSAADSTGLLDGFTFTGGNADGPGIDDKRGGAINAQRDMMIRNCLFTDNYCADLGGAFFAFGSLARGLRVSHCRFEKNRSNNRGGGVYIFNVPKFQVDSCDFIENEVFQDSLGALGGAAYAFNSSGIFLGNLFSKNTALRTGGGMVLAFNTNTGYNCTVRQCIFHENQASDGGGVYIFANGNNDNVHFDACEFTRNRTSAQLLGLSFGSGGAIGITHDRNSNASRNNIQVTNCQFRQNSTNYGGGGINYYNYDGQDNSMDIFNCEFYENTAGFAGGGVLIVTPNDDNSVSISRSQFESNNSVNGMAVGITRRNVLNISSAQQCIINNCLFTEHNYPRNLRTVLGVYYAKMNIINSTIADNEAISVSALESGEITLQNNILFNPGYPEYAIDPTLTNQANVSIRSAGGNLLGDTTLNRWIRPGEDLWNADPLFERGTFVPSFNSPAVDLGSFYTGFHPTHVDLAGNARWQGKRLDAGAYESPFTTAIKDLIVNEHSLKMYPIPVSSLATLELDNAWRGQLNMNIYNTLGQQVFQQKLAKHDEHARWQIDLSHLAVGNYRLVLTDGKEAAVKSFVKK